MQETERDCSPGVQSWNFSFGLPHGMERQARLLAPLPAELVDLARRAPLQLSYHLSMQFGDGSCALAQAGFVLPLYRQSNGGQSVVYRQADLLHFLHLAPTKAPGRSSRRAAVPCRLAVLQQLFHPAASALLHRRDTSHSAEDFRDDGRVGSSTDSNFSAKTHTERARENTLELVMCGIQPTLAAVVDSEGNSRHTVVVPPQPPACKVLHQILNDGGQGGAVVAALQAEMAAAATTLTQRDTANDSELEVSATVDALFGPTGSMVRIGVHRTLQTVPVQGGGESHTLAVYRLQMHADSLPVLALLHSALLHRAVKIDESAWRGWYRLTAAVAPDPALSQLVATLHREQQQLQTQTQLQTQMQTQVQTQSQQQQAQQQHRQPERERLSLQHRRIAQFLSAARDQEGPLRQQHLAMCDAEGLAQLSSDLRGQAENLIEIWRALRTAVAL